MWAFWFAAILIIQSQLPGQVQPGAVTGRLLSMNGTPAAGVRIAAVPVNEGQAGAAGVPVLVGINQTDGDGRYQLEGIPPGRYYIFAGLIDLPSYYPNATSLDNATAIEIAPGSTLAGIDFSMSRPTALTVTGRLALPVTMTVNDGWFVTLTPLARNTSTVSGQARVEADGTFSLPGVLPGEYRVSSVLRGSSPVSITVTDRDLTNVVIPVVDCNAGVRVGGRLLNLPTRIDSIALTGSSAGCTPVTRVEADGSFVFSSVPEGSYQYRPSPVPIGWPTMSLTVARSDISGIEIRLPELITLRGRAAVEDGSVFPNASRGTPVSVLAKSAGGEMRTSVHDDGTFELLLPRGRYDLSVSGIPAGYFVKWLTAGLADLSRSALYVNSASSDEIELMFGFLRPQAPRGVRVSGRLHFAPKGAFPKSEGVQLVSSEKSNTQVHTAAIDSDGSFEFSGVSPGVYSLETVPDSPIALHGIVVDKVDVAGIELALPILVNVQGGIEWSNAQGSGVSGPLSPVSVQFVRKDGSRVLAWGALAQSGAFHFYLPEGDYRFSIGGLPPDFNVGSVMVGDVNVLEDGLHVNADLDAPNLRVVLRGR